MSRVPALLVLAAILAACSAPAPASAPSAPGTQAQASAAASAAPAAASGGPNRPEAKPVTVDVKTSAVVVLDLSARCSAAAQPCSKIVSAVGEFLEKARAANMPIIYTVSLSAKGTPLGEVAPELKRRPNEPVIYPDGFDKFASGELIAWLKEKGAKTIILTGASTNVAVMYTATTAVRTHSLQVVLPFDGTVAANQYEYEYAIHQFTVVSSALTSDPNKLFAFTRMPLITFK